MKSYKQASTAYASRGTGGILITNSSYVGSVWKPKWSKAGEVRAETHVRFVGPLTEDRTNFQPWRFGPEQNEFGPWITRVPVFTGGTAETLSFIAAFADPNSPGDCMDTTVSPTPATTFLLHATKMAKADATLKVMLLDGTASKAAPLPKKMSAMGLAQAVLLRHGAKDYYKKPIVPVLMMFSPGACWALEDVLNKEVEGYKGDPLDLKARFVSGDILDANGGRIISFYNDLAGVAAEEAEAVVDWSKADSGGDRPKAQEFARYACSLKTKLPMPRNAQGQVVTPSGKPVFTPWEKVLRFMTDKEQVELLCRAYADLPGLLSDCLRPYRDMLPKFVKGDAQVTVPGNKPAAPSAALAAAKTPGTSAAADPDVADVTWGVPDEADVADGAELSSQMVPPTVTNAETPAASNEVAAEEAKIKAAMDKLKALRGATAVK